MNGAILLLPFILVRFLLLGLISKDGLQRAALFAPLMGREKAAYWVYEVSNLLLFVSLFFLKITANTYWLSAGLVICGMGLLLCVASVISFARPDTSGFNRRGVYRISRNPMYLSYFVFFLGCALLTRSVLLLALLAVFQLSSHWIILSEERWCIAKFGEEYAEYMKQVRRYL